jgi:serine/threonine protein phosphatase PrpC
MFIHAHAVAAYRPVLEDRALVMERPGSLIVVVADGAGGQPGGAAAAQGVVQRMGAAAAERLERPADWVALLRAADDALVGDPAAGETTAVALSLSPRGTAGASVGDSAAWIIEDAGCRDLTERQQRKPCVGSGMAAPIPFNSGPLQGTLLVATDGLLKHADPDRIYSIARQTDLEAAAGELVELVRLPSGELWDDVAVVLCRVRP